MFAYLTLTLLCLTALSAGYTITAPKFFNMEITSDMEQMTRVKEFINLVDMEKMKELLILERSPMFNGLVSQVASLDELKEILVFLESKGYRMQFLSDVLNSFLASSLKRAEQTERHTGLLDDVKAALSEEDYLETNPEVVRLLETLNTDEFTNMFNKLLEKIKELVDTYSTDIVKRICDFLKNILGDKLTIPLCK